METLIKGPRRSGKTTRLKAIALTYLATQTKWRPQSILYFCYRADNAVKFLPDVGDVILRTNCDEWVGHDFDLILIDSHYDSPWFKEIYNSNSWRNAPIYRTVNTGNYYGEKDDATKRI